MAVKASRKMIVVFAALATILTVSLVSAYYYSLWQRSPTILVTTQSVTARLIYPTATVIGYGTNTTEPTAWLRDSSHHFYNCAAIITNEMQLTDCSLFLNVTNIPSFLSVNISSIKLDRFVYHGSPNYYTLSSSTTLLSNKPCGGIVSFPVASAMYDTGVYSDVNIPPYSDKIAILMCISEYQVNGTSGSSYNLNTVISIGANS
jgi:hypothetical protein